MSSEKWFLSKECPEDYNTVEIESYQEDDPQGTRRFCADGTCPPAKVWVASLTRGGVKVESDMIWSHHPPIDAVIFQLEDEDFKKLMCRERGRKDHALGESGVPEPEDTGMVGRKFQG